MKKTITALAFLLSSLFTNAQTTQISSAYCGSTATDPLEFIWADSLGTPSIANNDRYIFKLVNGANTYTWGTNNEWPIMQFYNIPSMAFNTTYTVSVSYSNDYGNTFGPFGSTCTVTSPLNANTQLTTGSCGTTSPTYVSAIYCDNVGANQYEFRLINSALSYTQSTVRTNVNFNLSMFTGLTANTTYTVDVRTNLFSVWSAYGTACNITTPTTATTQLSAGSCNSSPATLVTGIFIDAVGGSTNYEYQFVNSSLSYTQTLQRTNANFNLSMFTGLGNGVTYSVYARVFIGGSWGPFGPICTVHTPTIPVTQLSSGSCNTNPASLTTGLTVDAIGGATQYDLTLYNTSLSYTQSVVRTAVNYNLSMYTGLQNVTTYSAIARVYVNSTWGTYGSVCTLGTPSVPSTQLSSGSCNSSPSSTSTGIFADAATGATHYEYRFINSSLSYTQSLVRATYNNFNLSMFTGLTINSTYSVDVRVKINGSFGPYGSVCTIGTPSSLRIMNPSYPNPFITETQFTIISESKAPIHVKVIDRMGRVIETQVLEGKNSHDISLGKDFGLGIYNVILNQGGELKAFKIIKN